MNTETIPKVQTNSYQNTLDQISCCTEIECGLFPGKVLNKRRIIGILKTFVTYNFHIIRTKCEICKEIGQPNELSINLTGPQN